MSGFQIGENCSSLPSLRKHIYWWKPSSPTTYWSLEQFSWLYNIGPPYIRTPKQGAVRQYHGCGLHRPSSGHQELCSLKGSKPNNFLDGNFLSRDLCRSHPRSGNLKSEPPQLPLPGSRGTCSLPRYIQSDISKMGGSQCRHPSLQIQQQSSSVYSQDKGSSSPSLECLDSSLVSVQANLRLPSSAIFAQSVKKKEQERIMLILIALNLAREN